MVAETWILKMGNQVSANLKHALLEHSRKSSKKNEPKKTIGILSFEIANVMSKTVILHNSLSDTELGKLNIELLSSYGIKELISDDEVYLLELVRAEKLDELNHLAGVVSRLGKRCSVPALRGFEHVYGDIVSGLIKGRDIGFLVKDMEGMVRRMERYVTSTASLYSEMEVLSELERATNKFKQNLHEECVRAFEQKLMWQEEDVRHLKDVSLWNESYNKVVELLARTVCTIYVRICYVFGSEVRSHGRSGQFKEECGGKSSQVVVKCGKRESISNGLTKSKIENNTGLNKTNTKEKRELGIRPQGTPNPSNVAPFRQEDFNFACGMGPGKLFMECLSLSTSASRVDDDGDYVDHDDRSSQFSGCCSVPSGGNRDNLNHSGNFTRSPVGGSFKCSVPTSSRSSPKSSLMAYARPSTIGGSALALHYANVTIVIEKLLQYPHLVGEEARDDLYYMLPTSLKTRLKTSLKSYIKDIAIFDASLAHDWKERIGETLKWLAPLAHNMIRWQTERNVEQQQVVKRTNVLLLQTLYFADRGKMEAVMCELLVGLNYICRYEHQVHALMDCASSLDFDESMDWQTQS